MPGSSPGMTSDLPLCDTHTFRFKVSKSRYASASSRRQASELCSTTTLLKTRGCREGRVQADTRGPRAAKKARGRTTRFSRDNPAFPARMVLTAYSVLSPASEFLVVTVALRMKGASRPVGLIAPPQGLAPATGVRTTRLRRPPQRRSSARPSIAHGRTALRCQSAPTLSRPPHPCPTFRDDAYAPLIGRDVEFNKSVSTKSRNDIFFARGLDRFSWTVGDLPVMQPHYLRRGLKFVAHESPAQSRV
jgi:hypothetical protein